MAGRGWSTLLAIFLLAGCGRERPFFDAAAERTRSTEETQREKFLHSGAIYDGEPAQAGELPWQAALVRYDQEPTTGLVCGATLISSEWAITAAHCTGCTTDAHREFQLLVGDVDLARAGSSGRIDVARVLCAPGVQTGTQPPRNDLALLQLASAAGSGSDAIGVLADSTFETTNLVSKRSVLVVSGWGRTAPGSGGTTSNQLLKAQVVYAASSDCTTWAPWVGRLGADHLCSTPSTKLQGVCTYDSGGPLVLLQGAGVGTLVGVVSSGRCASPEPALYARIAEHRAWIRSKAGV